MSQKVYQNATNLQYAILRVNLKNMAEYDTPERYQKGFEKAQHYFDDQIEATDYSALVAEPDTDSEAEAQLTDEAGDNGGFHPVVITSEAILRGEAGFLGRVLLLRSADPNLFSPAIITASSARPDQLQLTRLEVPYVPTVGSTAGIHFALSVKAQTRVAQFGGHSPAGGFEAGHFSNALMASRSNALAQDIVDHGDLVTHAVLANTASKAHLAGPLPQLKTDPRLLGKGAPEAMKELDLVPFDLSSKSLRITPGQPLRLLAFWHPGLKTEDGPLKGDYPGAAQKAIGAGFNQIDEAEMRRIRQLVDDVARSRHE